MMIYIPIINLLEIVLEVEVIQWSKFSLLLMLSSRYSKCRKGEL